MCEHIMTNKDLAKWLAQGKGEWCRWCCVDNYRTTVLHGSYNYMENEENQEPEDDIYVRKWGEREGWHRPTYEYCGVKRKKNENK